MFDDSEEERVHRAIVDTVVDNYDLIAQAQEANRQVEVLSSTAQAESDKLRESLIKLQAQGKTVMHAGTLWRRKKQVLSSAVAQHQKLLALAEAPALVEECIRGEMYHEALLVMEHMLRNHRYAQQGVGFFVRADQQMRDALESSLAEVVLPRLSGPLSLDAAFKIATFLRRLGVSADRLRLLFLERRSVYISRLVAEANSSPVAYSRMLKHINVYKVHVGEVVMQYCACFPTASASPSSSPSRDPVDAWDTNLRQWCHAQAGRFVAAFGVTIRDITNGSELALVVEQCSSCSTNVAKLHADVAPLLNAMIVERVKEVFAGHMRHAISAYTASMRTFAWRVPTTSYASAASSTAAPSADAAGSPPLALVQWLPLAYALNGLLTAFNAVRKCLVPGVEVFCVQHVEALVGRIASDLLRDGELASTMEDAERGVYSDLVAAFVQVFHPHVVLCTRKLLGAEVTRWLEDSLADSMEMLSRRLSAPSASEAAEAPPPSRPHESLPTAPRVPPPPPPQPQPQTQATAPTPTPSIPAPVSHPPAPAQAPPAPPIAPPQPPPPPPQTQQAASQNPPLHNPFVNASAGSTVSEQPQGRAAVQPPAPQSNFNPFRESGDGAV